MIVGLPISRAALARTLPKWALTTAEARFALTDAIFREVTQAGYLRPAIAKPVYYDAADIERAYLIFRDELEAPERTLPSLRHAAADAEKVIQRVERHALTEGELKWMLADSITLLRRVLAEGQLKPIRATKRRSGQTRLYDAKAAWRAWCAVRDAAAACAR